MTDIPIVFPQMSPSTQSNSAFFRQIYAPIPVAYFQDKHILFLIAGPVAAKYLVVNDSIPVDYILISRTAKNQHSFPAALHETDRQITLSTVMNKAWRENCPPSNEPMPRQDSLHAIIGELFHKFQNMKNAVLDDYQKLYATYFMDR